MSNHQEREAREARDELFLRILRHSDVTGQPLKKTAAELGLTAKQIGVLKRENFEMFARECRIRKTLRRIEKRRSTDQSEST